MHDYTDLTRRLADLIVGFGANVQPGQLVGVTSYLGKEELTREIARAAYERGARYVDVHYSDPWVKRQRLLHGDPETLDYIPPVAARADAASLGRARSPDLAQRPAWHRTLSTASPPTAPAATRCRTCRRPDRS